MKIIFLNLILISVIWCKNNETSTGSPRFLNGILTNGPLDWVQQGIFKSYLGYYITLIYSISSEYGLKCLYVRHRDGTAMV